MAKVVVKLGSAIVADDDGELRRGVLEGICDDVQTLHAAGIDVVIVTSGAIARGMHSLNLPVRPRSVDELQAASAVGQGGLFRSYEELLRERGLTPAQVLLTFFDLRARTHYLNARNTLEKLLEWRIVPVINENDTTTTDEISFGDNDFLAAQVAILLNADALILLTDIGGLYTKDPRTDPSAERIAEVSDLEMLADLEIGATTSALGSGGMRSKVVAAEMATSAGIPTVIANGLEPNVVELAWAGENVGTRFQPQPVRASSFKLWLRFAKPAHGQVTIDAGAARALEEEGTSLLPVGITAIKGEFDAGDAVEVIGPTGAMIGKGICNYSAAELQRVKGMKSAEVRTLLPRATAEAVHRDYFVKA